VIPAPVKGGLKNYVVSAMTDYLFRLPDEATGTLQSQIQEMMVDAITKGHLAPGAAMPSGRKLAEQLKVARNTVVLAYQQLLDEGFIVARERSGFYVSEDVLIGFARSPKTAPDENAKAATEIDWKSKLSFFPDSFPYLHKPQDWQRYPYPFVYGQFDKKLFPIADWRECCREAAGIAAIHNWASDHVDRDSEPLVDQVHSKLLPRRGIWADRDEILITVGAQNALFLASRLLLKPEDTVGMENPGYADARNTFLTQTQHIELLDIDHHGMVIDERLANCQCVYTTPSHQFPTTYTMSKARRLALLEQANQHNIVIIEDDYESEFNYGAEPIPALKSLDTEGRVIYVGSLSKTLAPGIRLGYMVAPREFIRQAKALRRIMLRHPPSNNQFIIAQFLKRGYHDALIRRISHTLHHRSQVMKTLLDEYLPGATQKPDFGGSSFWVRGPEDLDCRDLAITAKERGILIEAGSELFYPGTEKLNYFRLGFSSISVEQIRVGLPLLSELI
jgi:GntR family transcriptional regulator/MocR family aminotransferase